MNISDAFDAALSDVKSPTTWYVCLMLREQYYGGPEEGGWYGYDTTLVRFAQFPSEEAAWDGAEKVKRLAACESSRAHEEFNRMCLRSCDEAEARNEDVDRLPEVGGPDSYRVIVTNQLPARFEAGSRCYE
jgi:hypothetical protein